MIKTRKRSCAGIRQALMLGAALWSLPAWAAPSEETSADPAEQPVPQDAAGSAEPAPPAPNEILVTAQRRLQSIQDVPLAVTALDQQSLDTLQLRNASDLQAYVPNLSYTATNFGGVNYTIRGIGASVLGDGADTGVAFHYNGAFLQSGGSTNVFYDLEAVEVLRGPQGTLFGRNATGGAVNLRTRRPGFAFEAFAEAGGGSLGSYRGQAVINVPLSQTLAFRLAGYGEAYDGDIRNIANGNRINGTDAVSGRAALRWQPGADTTIDLTATYLHARGDGLQAQRRLCNRDPIGNLGCLPDQLAPGIPNFAATLTGLAAAGVGLVPFGDDPFLGSQIATRPRQVSLDFDPSIGTDIWIASVELEQHLGDLTLNLLGTFQDEDGFYTTDTDFAVAAGQFAPLFPGGVATSLPDPGNLGSLGGQVLGQFNRPFTFERGDGKSRQWLAEARLSSQFDGAFNFLVGGFFLDFDRSENLYQISSPLDALGQVLGAAPPFFRLETPVADLQSYAFFGEAYVSLSDRLRVTGGLRWSRDRKDQSNRSLLFSLPQPFDTNTLTQSALTGRAVIEWNPDFGLAEDALVYASYSRGFKGGGFNPQGVVAVPPTFDPEKVNAFEIGSKSSFGGGTTLNLAGFYYDYKGLQVSNIVNRTSVNENIDADLWGGEIELQLRPMRQLTFDVSFAYLGSRIGEASVIDPRDPTGGVPGTIAVKDINTAANCVATFAQLVTLLGGVPFGDCAALGLPAGNAVALEGNRLPNAPEWTVRVGAQFDENLSSRLALRIRADVTQRSDIWGRIFNRDPIDRLEGWGVVNGTVQISDIDERWYLRLEGSNLFDSAGATGMFVADASSGLPTNLFLLPARRVIAVAGVRF